VRKGFARPLLGRRDQRGSTLVEFAFAFPVLCGLLFGIIDGGRFVGARVALSQATAEAARTACLSSTTTAGMVDTSLTNAGMTISGANIDWANTFCNGAANCPGTWPLNTGDIVFLTAQYNFQALFFKGYFSKTLTQTSRMVCE
jgi:Flp pilus assembly protein TadG